jgi:hypothetical protein
LAAGFDFHDVLRFDLSWSNKSMRRRSFVAGRHHDDYLAGEEPIRPAEK